MVTERIKNASVDITGLAGLLLITGTVIRQASPQGGSLIPGLSSLAGLALPALCLWVGLLLRHCNPSPPLWIKLIVACAVTGSLYMSRHGLWYEWRTLSYLYLLSMGAGFLFPESQKDNATGNKGWDSLVLLLLSAFCFTAVTVVLQRIGRMDMRGHDEMRQLLFWLLTNCRPLLVVISLYFLALFSFSRTGQAIGRTSWIQGIAAAAAVCCFPANLRGRMWYFSDLFRVLVQPVSIYIILVLSRMIRRREKGLSWGDVFRV